MREAPLEPIDPGETPPGAGGGPPNWLRIKAGLSVELGLADRGAARRAQEAVAAGEFDVDREARELLASAPLADGDPRLSERSARLARDLMMAPLQRGARGAGRRVRRATRRGAAWVVTQFLVLGALLAIFVLALLAVRYGWGVSVDELLDRVLCSLPER